MSLTGRALLLAAAVALLGIVEQWVTPLPFPLWRLLAAALVGSLLYEWLTIRAANLAVTAAAETALPLGRSETVALEIGNPGRRPLAVQFAPALPAELAFAPEPSRVDVAPGGSTTAPVPVRALVLGQHRWVGVPARILGPLGLAWWTRRYRFQSAIDVIPDLLRVPERVMGLAEQGSTEHPVAGGGAELHHLREYRPGDARHSIDWKASARTGKLITRVHGEDQHLEIVVLLDAGRTAQTEIAELAQLGHFVNVAARFAEHAAAAEDRVGLVAVADRVLARAALQRGLPGVLGVRRALIGLTPQPVESDLVLGALEVSRLVRHRALVLILTDLYGQDVSGRLVQGLRLLLPRHLPVVAGLVGSEVMHLAEQPARRWLDPYRSLAAREYRDQLWRNAASLRRQGARTIVTTPETLEGRVLSLYRDLKAARRV